MASEIGVTKQAIHKKIKQEPLATSLQGLTETKGNVIYVSVDGEKLIKSAFIKGDLEITTTKKTGLVDDYRQLQSELTNSLREQLQDFKEQSSFLQDQNKDLSEQLTQEREHSREQTDRITELATEMAKLANNAQHLHAGDIMPRITDPMQPTSGGFETPPQKSGIFQRLFKKSIKKTEK